VHGLRWPERADRDGAAVARLAVDTEVVVPNSPGLVGAAFRQQVLPFVFDLSGLIELTSTNALTLTLGAF